MLAKLTKKNPVPRLSVIFDCSNFTQTLGAIQSLQKYGYVVLNGTKYNVIAPRQAVEKLLTQFNLASKMGCRRSVDPKTLQVGKKI